MNPYQVVISFEEEVARWAGSKYAVAVDSCSTALFLSFMYHSSLHPETEFLGRVSIPKHTYPSVPCAIIHAGGIVDFDDREWNGTYTLDPFNVVDGALRFRKGMYQGGLHCLSFHVKKRLKIGRGGMILTDDEEASKWLKKARFDGGDPVALKDDNFTMLGWNAYMTPAQAALGLQLFYFIKDQDLPDLLVEDQVYPDLSQFPIYKQNENKTL